MSETLAMPAFLQNFKRTRKPDMMARTGEESGGVESAAPVSLPFNMDGTPTGGASVNASEAAAAARAVMERARSRAAQNAAALAVETPAVSPPSSVVNPSSSPGGVTDTGASRPRRAQSSTVPPAVLGAIENAPVAADSTLPPGAVSRQTLAPSVEYDPNAGASRARVAKPLEFEEKKNVDLRNAKPEKSGWRAIVPLMVQGFLAGASRGDIVGGIGGAAAAGVAGAADRTLPDRLKLSRQIAASDQKLVGLRARRKLDDEHNQSEAQTEWTRQRPAIEQSKADLKRKYDEWRMRSGDRKQNSLESYREFMLQLGDRRATTAEGRLELEREWKTVIQPEQFNRTFDQREDHFTRRQSQQQRQFDQVFGLNVDKYIEGQRHNLVGEAQKTFDVATKGRVERLRAIHSEVERWEKRKADNSTRPGEADEYISDLRAEALGLAGQIEAAREMALSGVSSSSAPVPGRTAPSLAPPVRRSGPGSVSSRPAPVVTEAQIRAKAIENKLDPDIAVQRARLRGDIK